MSKGIDEIKEKAMAIGAKIWHEEITVTDGVNQILSLETLTHRIAIVKKKPELPDLPLFDTGAEQETYRIAQLDMLDSGFVQEGK